MDVAADVGEQKWTLATHFFRIVFHDFQACTDIRSQINLVDDEKIGPCNARAAFPRNLIALSDIDNKDRGVHKLRTERSGEVVTAALDKEKLDVREPLHHLVDGLEVHRSILADRGVRAAAGLHADDAFHRKDAVLREKLCVLLCINIVGDNANTVIVCHFSGQCLNQCRFSGADRSCYSNFYVRHNTYLFF